MLFCSLTGLLPVPLAVPLPVSLAVPLHVLLTNPLTVLVPVILPSLLPVPLAVVLPATITVILALLLPVKLVLGHFRWMSDSSRSRENMNLFAVTEGKNVVAQLGSLPIRRLHAQIMSGSTPFWKFSLGINEVSFDPF